MRVPVTHVCIMSPVNLKFLRHTDFQQIVGTGHSDKRSTTLYLSDTSVAWAIGDKAAIIRGRCCCFALCEDSGVQFMFLANVNCTSIENTLFAKKISGNVSLYRMALTPRSLHYVNFVNYYNPSKIWAIILIFNFHNIIM